MRSLLPLFLLPLITAEITFSVEEPPLHPKGKHRHHHKHRHQRDHPAAPQDKPLPRPERFALSCPHISDADNKEVHIETTWTLDDTVIVKIKDGNVILKPSGSTFRKRGYEGKNVVHVTHNRYEFNYDELTGDFTFEINEVHPLDDFGSWQCHVIRRRGTETFSESTMKSIVAPPGGEKHRAAKLAKEQQQQMMGVPHQRTTPSIDTGYRNPESRRVYPKARIDYGSDGEEYQTRTTQKFSAFTRPDQNSVQISRDTVERRRQTVVFDRSVTKGQHSVDYELSMADEDDDFRYESQHYSKQTRAALGANSAPGPFSLLVAAVTVALLHARL